MISSWEYRSGPEVFCCSVVNPLRLLNSVKQFLSCAFFLLHFSLLDYRIYVNLIRSRPLYLRIAFTFCFCFNLSFLIQSLLVQKLKFILKKSYLFLRGSIIFHSLLKCLIEIDFWGRIYINSEVWLWGHEH